METKQCKRCHHYIQHYGLKEGRLFPVYCGHCAQGKPKRRLPDAESCQQFIPGEADTEAFVTPTNSANCSCVIFRSLRSLAIFSETFIEYIKSPLFSKIVSDGRKLFHLI